MRICFVAGYYDPDMPSGADVVDRVYTLREFAQGQAALGHEVHVVHLFGHDETFVDDVVTYHFLRPSAIFAMLGKLTARLRRDRQFSYYQLGDRLAQRLRQLQPDVIHFFGLTLNLNLWLVARTARRLGVPLIAQYHGGGPARDPLRRAIQRRNLDSCSALLFTTREHAEPWLKAGTLEDSGKIVEFMETSSFFRRSARASARSETGMNGQPVFVWTGRLHPIKDPITALRGFEMILVQWPEAQLYLYYLTAEMQPEIESFLAGRPVLAEHVHLRGRAPFEQMEAIYNSADFLLQASLREFSGCAVLEALACGVIPVVTDIPSFRTMTAGGRFGVLFSPGDAEALARGVCSIGLAEIPARSSEIRAHFDTCYSFPVLSRQLESIYEHARGKQATPVESPWR